MGARKTIYLILILLICSCTSYNKTRREYIRSFNKSHQIPQKRQREINKLRRERDLRYYPNMKCPNNKC